MILRTSNHTRTRRGAILIVVLALLTIFAVVGITFVFYSGAEADGSRIFKQAQSQGNIDTPDSTDVVNAFLGALLYDAGDTAPTDLQNSLRGHSLARTMYGWNGTIGNNLTPFNGVGTFHGTATGLPDRAYVVNHTAVNGNVYDPEWTQPRTSAQLNTAITPSATNIYIPKNAPYTYFDANNLALAAVSPQTGEVLVPSYYREWQFGNLQPTNPNWTNTQGRYTILRPRPQDNIADSGDGRGQVSDFPYCPANADGSYTGDVQNLPGGFVYNSGNGKYEARNDSIWIDIGLPARQWNGKWIKPLVAALILDKDGCLNLSAHGNNRNGGTHGSHSGVGPWEVNLNYVLGADAQSVVQARNNNNPNPLGNRAGVSSIGYAYSAPQPPAPPPGSAHMLQSVSQVNWDGTNGGIISTPGNGGNSPYATYPSYGTGFDDNVQQPSKQINHPSLFNPAEWPAQSGNLRTFSPTDLRRLSGRFGADLDFYQQLDLAKLQAPLAPPTNSLISSTNGLDASHRNRLVVTTFGATLDFPGSTPGQVPGTGTQFQMAGVPSAFPFNQPGNYNQGSYASPPLAPLNLNRPLTDYRNDTTTALNPMNAANSGAAQQERHNFARDIFARLVLSTGGGFAPVAGGYSNGVSVTVYTSTTTVGMATYQPGDVQLFGPASPGTPQYDALRYLAQLAANIVDYIDNDDVSTLFVWNAANPLNPFDPNAIPGAITTGAAVFGVEKPRLVINEVYSEIANAPGEMGTDMMAGPTNPAQIRFWVELLNPTSTPYLAGPTGPLGDGSAQLRTPGPGGSNPYRLQIIRNGGTAAANLQDRTNTTGNPALPTALTPEIQYDFAGVNMGAATSVSPNNGNYAPGGNAANGIVVVGPSLPPTGMGGVSPQPFEFNPTNPPGGMPPGAPWSNMIQSTGPAAMPMGPQNCMTYTVPMAGGMMMPAVDYAFVSGMALERHMVVLQRLANPYLPANDPSGTTFNPAMPVNPYLTVDYMDRVNTFDAVTRLNGEMTPRMERSAMVANGYDPVAERFAIGKVQPYAGHANATAQAAPAPPTFNFPSSCVLNQRSTDRGGEPLNTFGRHNGLTIGGPGGAATPPADTLMSPFDMMLHLDRPLINQLELLHVAAVPPHQLTQDFVREYPAGSSTIRKDMAHAPWLGTETTTSPGNPVPGFDVTNNRTNNGLYRSLSLLRVKPWTHGVPMGGKVHGRININTVQDPRVLQALFDPQAGNNFNGSMGGNFNTWFNGWLNTRTMSMPTRTLADGSTTVVVPVPGRTYDDDPTFANPDRPFKPFGVSELATGPLTGASGLQDTILRTNGGTQPLLWQPLNPGSVDHPYQQAEAARKILNNTTTVSNSFVAFFTVGYFEVRTNNTGNPMFTSGEPTIAGQNYNRPILGREAYREVPGDMRSKFYAVIDRNNLMLNPNDNNPLGVGVGGPVRPPYFTTLEASLPAGSMYIDIAANADPNGNPAAVYADGVPVPLRAGDPLVIGIGAEQVVTRIASTAEVAMPLVNLAPGIYRVMLPPTAPLPRAVEAGSCVSNARFGNPGPQANINATDPNSAVRQTGVIRDYGEVR